MNDKLTGYKGFDKTLKCKDFQFKVDGEKIKSLTFYKLENGKPVETI